MTQDELKQAVARAALKYVVDDAWIGVGSGSTANYFIDELAKMKNRMQAMVCASSIGPGATNMITGAAVATINRLPVLLLAG